MRCLKCAIWLVLSCWASGAWGAEALETNHVMYDDPRLIWPDFEYVFRPELKTLWKLSLERPESELQRMAADTVALAHAQGMGELATLSAGLAAVLKNDATEPTVRRAVAHALVALDAKTHAADLAAAAAKSGLEVQILVEAALAEWKDAMLVPEWRRRLESSSAAPQSRMLAIRGLGALRDRESGSMLRAIVVDRRAPSYERLAAAQSLAELGHDSALADAKDLLSDRSARGVADRILAVTLLSRRDEPDVLETLSGLATDDEPAVVAAALDRVLQVEPKRVFELAPVLLKSTDVKVRRVGALALLTKGDGSAIVALTPVLDDPNPSLRRRVAHGLLELAKNSELRPAVITAAETSLKAESWRAAEQGILLVGHLEHAAVAQPLVGLLKHRRHEVAVAAAWALRILKQSETYEAILEHAKTQQARRKMPDFPFYERNLIYAQFTQIFQLFGETDYEEAVPLLREFVPKATDMGECRTAACWALGKIYEGGGPADLAKQFAERLADVASMPPEESPVRFACAIALGRMKAEDQLPALRRFGNEGTEVSLACHWSIEKITGEKPPTVTASKFQVLNWFLQPADK